MIRESFWEEVALKVERMNKSLNSTQRRERHSGKRRMRIKSYR